MFKKISYYCLFAIGMMMFFADRVLATGLLNKNTSANIISGYGTVSTNAGYQTSGAPTVNVLIANIIQYVLGFLGIFFLILTIYSGYQWMFSNGNSEIIKKSRERLINAVIGLVIVLAAYTLTYYLSGVIFSSLTNSGTLPQ